MIGNSSVNKRVHVGQCKDFRCKIVKRHVIQGFDLWRDALDCRTPCDEAVGTFFAGCVAVIVDSVLEALDLVIALSKLHFGLLLLFAVDFGFWYHGKTPFKNCKIKTAACL